MKTLDVPLIKRDNQERLNTLMIAKAGKPSFHKTSVGRSGLVDDPAREFERLRAEETFTSDLLMVLFDGIC